MNRVHIRIEYTDSKYQIIEFANHMTKVGIKFEFFNPENTSYLESKSSGEKKKLMSPSQNY